MTIPVLSHDEAVAVGALLRGRVTVPPQWDDELGWGDVVQFVLLRAREIVEARAAAADAAVRDSEVSRAPVTRTIAEIQDELREKGS